MAQPVFHNYALSIVVPLYNEGDNVEPLLTEILTALQDHPHYEILFVDDGSTDHTPTVLRKLAAAHPELTVIRHQGNYGQSAGVVTGVRHAKYSWIVTLDGDGQNDPADIPRLIECLAERSAPVFIAGNRRKRQDTRFRQFSSKIANAFRQRLLQDDCPDSGCGLKCFAREHFLQIPHFNHLHRFLPALFKRQGIGIINLEVNHRPRERGESKYGMWNRLWVGIIDVLGVAWLIKRPCNPPVERGQ